MDVTWCRALHIGTPHGGWSPRREAYRTSGRAERYAAGMPIYEFACSACNNEFEELVSMTGSSSVKCPSCGSKRTEKQLSSFQRVRVGRGDVPAAVTAAAGGGGGGCCGGGCGCG